MMEGTAAASEAASRTFSRRLSSLAEGSVTSDFTITCGTKYWRVHQAVLEIHSKVFQVWCSGQFSESKEKQVDLSEHGDDCVAALVHYLYAFDYVGPVETTDSGKPTINELLFHTMMLILADKYDLPPLKHLALEKYKGKAKVSVTAGEFSEAAACAYHAMGATKDLRKFMAELVISRSIYPAQVKEGKEESDFETAMKACPDMAIDIATALAQRPGVSALVGGCHLKCIYCRTEHGFVADIGNRQLCHVKCPLCGKLSVTPAS